MVKRVPRPSMGDDPLAALFAESPAAPEPIAEEAAPVPAEVNMAVPEPELASEAENEMSTENPLQLEARAGIAGVAELAETLTALLQGDGAVAIDTSSVESVDTATLQALSAFAIALKIQERELSWSTPSESFGDAVRLLGLGAHLL